MRAALLALVLLAGCLRDHLVECGTQLCPVDRVCAPNGSCVAPEQLTACSGLTDGLSCTYADRQGHCRSGVCEASACGDATLDSPEQCDGPDLGGATCLTYGYYNPDGLSCSADCSVDTSQCVGKCGDGITNGPELCDTTPGDVFTCYEVGFDYGSVKCSPQLCAPVYDGCITIGWREQIQNGDYSPGAYAPRLGEVYIVNGAINGQNYLHAMGVTRVRVPRPDDCSDYNSGIWASDAGEVFLGNSDRVCEHVGTTWTQWPMPPGVTVRLVWGTSGHDVYAVGSEVMHFDGTAWSRVDTGAPSGASFMSIAGRVGGLLAIGTDQGGVAVYDNNTWTYEVIHDGTRIEHLWTSPNGTVYAVGDQMLYTKTGSTWTGSIPAPLTQVMGVWGVSDTGVYLHGSSTDHYSAVWFFDGQKTIDLGALDDLSYFGGGPDNLLAVAVYSKYYESSGYFFTPLASTGQLYSLWAFSLSNIVALSSFGDLWRFDGAAWTSSALAVRVTKLWAASPTNIIAVGAAGATATYDGNSWTTSHLTVPADLSFVWGETSDRVFAVGVENASTATDRIFYYDGSTWQLVYTRPITAYAGFRGMWGSASAGTFVIRSDGTTLLHLPPGAAPTDWTEVTLPDTEAIGVWGTGDQAVVTFSDGQAYSFKNGAWTNMPTRGLAAAGELSGPQGDVFGVNAQGSLVHWDGTVWDQVRLAQLPGAIVETVFSGNGAVVVGSSNGGVTLLVQP